MDKELKKFAETLVGAYGNIDTWTTEQAYQVAREIVENKPLSKKIASGNLSFLENAVLHHQQSLTSGKTPSLKYAQGIKKHIKQALPYQWGFIAPTGPLTSGGAATPYDIIAKLQTRLETATPEELIEDVKIILGTPELHHPKLDTTLTPLKTILTAYEKKKGPEQKQYGLDKSKSIKNLLGPYLANLTGYLSKK